MKGLLVFIILISCVTVQAQTIKGKLYGEDGTIREILPGGTIRWMGSDKTVLANENGVFELELKGIADQQIIASCTGFITDTISAEGKTYLSIVLKKEVKQLGEVVVKDSRGSYISSFSVIKTEVINQKELSKAACCDLAGCFGTQASVQAHTTNIVTNAQELRILGLSGVYNQLLVDGLPLIQGSTYTYGISTYPGTVIENIYVSKGTNSVLQGFESISGQINLDSRQPDKADRLHLNGYINSFGEKHVNANIASPVSKNKNWHSLLALHTVLPSGKIDGNDDGFLDLPLLTRYMAYNKWKYRNEKDQGLSVQIGLRFVHEKRIGGQTQYGEGGHKGSNTIYGQFVSYNQPELYSKLFYRVSEDHAIALSLAGTFHDQNSWFGVTKYSARQKTGYLNFQHEWLWNKKHELKYGLSYRYQQLEEKIDFSFPAPGRTYAGEYVTKLRVPGLFAENTFHFADNKLVWIAGARLDHHQDFGWYFTSRTMVKYALNNKHTLRASIGSGWRQVNLFSEQVAILTSSRNIEFSGALKPEKAINWGLSHTYRFNIGSTSGTLSGDLYGTIFNNQFFPDYDSDPSKIIINNYEGLSRSYGLQLEANFLFFKQLEFKGAYNYLDVYRKENGKKIQLSFNPQNRAMTALSFKTSNNIWQADVNAHWFDKMRLPETSANPEPYRRPSYSTAYGTMSMQGTFRLNKLELYGGCENVFNYRQPNPIISADNPFGPYFDLSSVWGPTRGREFYFGVRYSIK